MRKQKRFELECSVGVIKLYLFYIYLNIFVLYCIQCNEYVKRYCIYKLKIIANVIYFFLKNYVFSKKNSARFRLYISMVENIAVLLICVEFINIIKCFVCVRLCYFIVL